jgi:alkylated DNA repair dioxygenase AlkB
MLDLFAEAEPWQEPLAPGAVILRRFALSRAAALFDGINAVAARSPFRHMVTPGGYTMSVAMTNCGRLGWTTDDRGYLYAPLDPITGNPGPPCPMRFRRCAMMPPWLRVTPILPRMPAWLTATPLARNSRCIRIKMSRIYGRLLSRSL